MRVLCGVMAVMLIVFAAVQYNDPNPLFWGAIYGAGALWCGLAAVRPGILRRQPARGLLAVSIALSALGVLVFWPAAERWWSIDVWWPEVTGEPVREGMGMMVLALSLLLAASLGLRRG